MTDTIICAILALVGTLVGTFGGILTSAKMTNYRLDKLEKTVDKHNSVIERTYKCEGAIAELQHEIKDIKDGVIKL